MRTGGNFIEEMTAVPDGSHCRKRGLWEGWRCIERVRLYTSWDIPCQGQKEGYRNLLFSIERLIRILGGCIERDLEWADEN